MVTLDKPQEEIVLGDDPHAKAAMGLFAAIPTAVLLFALKDWSRIGALILSTIVLFALMYAGSVWFKGRLSISDSMVVIRPHGYLSRPVRLMRTDIVNCSASVRRPTTAAFILVPVLALGAETRSGAQHHWGPYSVRRRDLARIQKAVEELGGEWQEMGSLG
jgi:hypothetical protein